MRLIFAIRKIYSRLLNIYLIFIHCTCIIFHRLLYRYIYVYILLSNEENRNVGYEFPRTSEKNAFAASIEHMISLNKVKFSLEMFSLEEDIALWSLGWY